MQSQPEETHTTSVALSTDEKIALIKRNLQEVTEEDMIRNIIEKRPLRIYWGTAITGKPHIAYFLPIMKLRDYVNAGCLVKVLLADIHGFLDSLKAPVEKVADRLVYYERLIKAMLTALGVDLAKVEFVRGSSFQRSEGYIFDLYKMSSLTSVHDCIRAGSQVVKQTENPLLSTLIYPLMQALDEEYLDIDAQFGGVDQRKIFMHAQKYMPKLGYRKRAYLMNPMMAGLNSEKMSSSDELGKIDVLDTRAAIKKKISKCFCEPGNTDTGALVIFKFIVFGMSSAAVTIGGKEYSNYEEVEAAFANQEIHPGDLKEALVNCIDAILAPVREAMADCSDLIARAYN